VDEVNAGAGVGAGGGQAVPVAGQRDVVDEEAADVLTVDAVAVAGVDRRAAGAVGADGHRVGGGAAVGGVEDHRAVAFVERDVVGVKDGRAVVLGDPDIRVIEVGGCNDGGGVLRPRAGGDLEAEPGDFVAIAGEGDAGVGVA